MKSQRIVKSYRLHPLVARVIEEKAITLKRSPAWVIESMTKREFPLALADFEPGEHVSGGVE